MVKVSNIVDGSDALARHALEHPSKVLGLYFGIGDVDDNGRATFQRALHNMRYVHTPEADGSVRVGGDPAQWGEDPPPHTDEWQRSALYRERVVG